MSCQIDTSTNPQRKNGVLHLGVFENFLTNHNDFKKWMMAVENKVDSVQSKNKADERIDIESPGNLLDHLAENVDVVGLVEATGSSRRFMRYIWALLFLCGIGLTVYYIYANADEYLRDPTATVVKLIPQPEYPYPPLILCPKTWVDNDKIALTGLTRDAYKYSLAYASVEGVDSTTDTELGREEFFKFYQSKNYSSLFDYLKDISMDLESLNSQSRSALKPADSLYACYRCKNKTEPLEKVFVDNRICYVVEFKPETEKRFRNWNSAPEVTIRVKASSGWRAYLFPNKYSRQPHYSFITLAPNQASTVKLSMMRFVTMDSENYPCVQDEPIAPKKKRYSCVTKCLYEVYLSQHKCRLFPYESYNVAYELSDYCNYYDKVDERNLTHFEVWGKNMSSPLESEEAEACVKKCPPKCDRKIFTATLDSQVPITIVDDWTTIGVRLDYIPVTQGGIMTLTEISTLSWVGFVSNIGGTLGLFIGGTALNFFQILMAIINYLLDARAKRKVKDVNPDKTSTSTTSTNVSLTPPVVAAISRRLTSPCVTQFGQFKRSILESTSSSEV